MAADELHRDGLPFLFESLASKEYVAPLNQFDADCSLLSLDGE